MSSVTLCEVRIPGSLPGGIERATITAEWDSTIGGYRVRQEGRADVLYPSAHAAVAAACRRAARAYKEAQS